MSNLRTDTLNVINGPSEQEIILAHKNLVILSDTRICFYLEGGIEISVKISSYGYPLGNSILEIDGVIDRADRAKLNYNSRTRRLYVCVKIKYDIIRRTGMVIFNNYSDLESVRS